MVLKRYVTGFPTEDDMELVVAAAGAVTLAVPPGSRSVLVKNLYLSCDPYMRGRMSKHDDGSYVQDFVPGEVRRMESPHGGSSNFIISSLFLLLLA